ncbi:MAG TPA: ECF-type sigma factor [Steroidobacteraceae bacterium]|nr:ECF-type sigma factor [Steroidobacteraceae bacterium]
MGSVTQLLDQVRRGDAQAQHELFSHLYGELDRLARTHLSRNAPMTLIDGPALIREVYLRVGQQADLPGRDRRAFLAYASRAMRSVIIDYLRARGAERRGGGQQHITLNTAVENQVFTDPQLESLDDALKSLERIDERAHRVVEMRYFGGMEIEEIADFLEISAATVKRDWHKARAFLLHALSPPTASTP